MSTEADRAVMKLVLAQAEDECLWFEAETAPEAYLQAALRKLHAAVETSPPPAQPPQAEPVETVPWPTVTRYSGGASHDGIGGRVWIQLDDNGAEVEYVPAAQPKREPLPTP